MSDILKGKKILVVDDEADLREPLATEFESLGCVVFQAKNGVEALEIVRSEKLDAVISDIRMPGGDGIELLKNIKKQNHHFPVVMLITGFSDLSKEDAYDLGAEAILAKPFDLDELNAAVERILSPHEVRWTSTLDSSRVRKKIEKTFPDLNEAVHEGEMSLGRGGFFFKAAMPIGGRNELLSFHFQFKKGAVSSLNGYGIVRWSRSDANARLPAGSGIEFTSLDEESRTSLLKVLGSLDPKPFIPKE